MLGYRVVALGTGVLGTWRCWALECQGPRDTGVVLGTGVPGT